MCTSMPGLSGTPHALSTWPWTGPERTEWGAALGCDADAIAHLSPLTALLGLSFPRTYGWWRPVGDRGEHRAWLSKQEVMRVELLLRDLWHREHRICTVIRCIQVCMNGWESGLSFLPFMLSGPGRWGSKMGPLGCCRLCVHRAVVSTALGGALLGLVAPFSGAEEAAGQVRGVITLGLGIGVVSVALLFAMKAASGSSSLSPQPDRFGVFGIPWGMDFSSATMSSAASLGSSILSL